MMHDVIRYEIIRYEVKTCRDCTIVMAKEIYMFLTHSDAVQGNFMLALTR